ncbi:Ribosomal RNA large subunit methyltransferase K/L [Thalassocella blandensis]|nr:Ribosomal RNA large subunit methyltransferase K/L [Thalassocella blandensis]
MASSNKKNLFTEEQNIFVTCPAGMEQLLVDELNTHAISVTRETAGGVYCRGNLQSLYTLCLWSRVANRVLLSLADSPVETADQLYAAVQSIEWPSLFGPQASLLVNFIGANKQIRNTHFAALTVKDAIIDQFRSVDGVRPSIEKSNPDVRINVRLAKGKAHIALDVSGESLHKRGYRVAQGDAPLKENLAAAVLIRAGWSSLLDTTLQTQMPDDAPESSNPLACVALLDPMCGSATLLIEGALMAANIAPGLTRKKFGFEKLSFHDETLWQQTVNDALQKKQEGLARAMPEIRGYDINHKVLDAAAANIAAAGLDDYIRLSKKDAADFKKPTHINLDRGLLICNPPYGERLGEIEALRKDYQTLGQVVKTELPGWQVGIFTGNKELAQEMRLRPKRRYKLFNGKIPSELVLFDIQGEESILRVDNEQDSEQDNEQGTEQGKDQSISEERKREPAEQAAKPMAESKERLQQKDMPLSDGAKMVLNRLKKNRKRLNAWLKQEGVMCYRLYDADMPEYSAAIDVYQQYLHIQEYQAPKSIDENKAQARFEELVCAAAHYFDCTDDFIVIKQRRRNRGTSQYEKLQKNKPHSSGSQRDIRSSVQHKLFAVSEGKAQLEINLWDYLDTGLFLDHRPLRLKIAEEVRGKHFLNLFCYTATASVHAALGGAAGSVSVDMSKTYLDWAARNYSLNNINPVKHELVNADCTKWLRDCRQGFDVIMLDPPSFSNSKKMRDVFDVQRDHVSLIKRCMELLNPNGVLYFSNNLRSFTLDEGQLGQFNIQNISEQTLAPDFKQNPKIHYCWEIRHA